MRLFKSLLLVASLCLSQIAAAESLCVDTGSSASTGDLYDSGGPSANYSNNENCSFLINPSAGRPVTITFNNFDIERPDRDGRGGDVLEIYDGIDASFPRIARVDGVSGNPVSYTANSGSIFIQFRSNDINNQAGFSASWAVEPPISSVLRGDWHLDELSWQGTAGEIKDYSGNYLHGVASKAMLTIPDGAVCRAIDLQNDALTDYIELDSNAFNGLTNFTYSVWGKTSETGSQALLSGFGNDHGNELLLLLDRDDYFQFLIKNDSFTPNQNGINSNVRIADNQWHHFAFTRNSDRLCVYIDGRLAGCRTGQPLGALNLAGGAVIVGQEQDSLRGSFDQAQDWDGFIDEPLLFERALTEPQIRSIYDNQKLGLNYDGSTRRCSLPDPVVDYRFDSCNWADGQEVIDSGPNRFDAYAVNGVLSTIDGKICGLARFDSMDDFVRLPDRAEVDIVEKLTVTSWVRLKNQPSELKSILSKDTNYEFHINSNRQVFWWWVDASGNVRWITAPPQITLNEWHHIAIVYRSGLQQVYLDGQEVARTTFEGQLMVNGNDLQIGQDQGFGVRFFDGDIDEVKIFADTLDEFEVESIYNNESAGKNYDGALRPCACTEPSQVKHYAVSHSGSLVNCMSEEITISAHNDANAPVNAGANIITVTTSTAKGEWGSVVAGGGVLTNLGNGQATYQFPDNGESEVTLSFTYPELAGDSEAVNFDVTDGNRLDRRNNADAEDLDLIVSSSGFVFDVPDTESCLVSSVVSVRAVKTVDGSLSCGAAVSGQQTVDFISSYLQPSSGTQSVIINAQGVNYNVTSAEVTPVALAFDADGAAEFVASYMDAGRVSLDLSLATEANTLQGSDDWVAYPESLALKVSDTGSVLLDNAVMDAGIVWPASKPFNIEVVAQCSTGVVTPNYVPVSSELGAQMQTPLVADGASSGVVSLPSGGLVVSDTLDWMSISSLFTDGVMSVAATYNEAGVITMSARDADYYGHVIGATVQTVGRFVPAFFDVSANSPTISSYCPSGSFNYLDAWVGFEVVPQVTVRPLSFSGVTVKNYGASLWRLDSAFSGRSFEEAVSPAFALLESNISLDGGDWQGSADNFDGSAINELLGDQLRYKKGVPEAPFDGKVDYVLSVSDLTDPDNVCYKRDENGNGDWSDDVCQPYRLSDIAAHEMRFGRLVVDDAYGPETEKLPLAWQTQHFDGVNYVVNALDSCTTWLLSEVVMSDLEGTIVADSQTELEYGYPSLDFRVEAGDANAVLSPPGEGNAGTIRLQVDLSRLPFLMWDADGDGSLDSPEAEISFGQYRSHDRVIFQRQN